MNVLHLDYETKSAADLRKVGLVEYAKHPTTEVICAGYAFDDGPSGLWRFGESCPASIANHIIAGKPIWAHNAAFELAITSHICAKRYSWPAISPAQAVCTMAMSYAMGLPGSLEGCAAALGVTEQKDIEGRRLMLQMSKPRTKEPLTWWDDEERLKRLYAYCLQDVKVERAVGKRMLQLSPYERRVWLLDQKINNVGIAVDVAAVKRAIEVVEWEKDRLNDEMYNVSDGNILSCSAVQQMKDYLEFFGVGEETLNKASLGEQLNLATLHPKARAVLSLRAEAGKASVAKFRPMVESAGADDRIRGCFQYSPAHTRRWGGRRVQLQNLKRPQVDFSIIESLIQDLKKGISAEEINVLYGPPMSLLGDCTRSFLVAAPAHTLLVADYASIEARVLAWLANESEVLNVFRSNKDIYKVAAAQIFGCSADEVTSAQRQVGKVAVLALGYGGGIGAFQTMAKAYGVKMEPAYEYLLESATPDQRKQASNRYRHVGAEYPDISEKEFIASELTKIIWRENNQNIVAYWTLLEDTAIHAIRNPGKWYKANSISYSKQGSFLLCRLPGGGLMCYPYPELKPTPTLSNPQKVELLYKAEANGQWRSFSTYGGSLAENVTQAVARNLLADAMLRLDDANYKIVVHIHDEIVCEMPECEADLDTMIKIMIDNPSWANGLPLAATGFVSQRYRK